MTRAAPRPGAAAVEDLLTGRRVLLRAPVPGPVDGARAKPGAWRSVLWRRLEEPGTGALDAEAPAAEHAAVRAWLRWRARWSRARGAGRARDRDLRAALALAERLPALARLIPASRPPSITPRSEPAFEALAKAIVYQQLSGKAAATIWGRACALFPGQRPTPAAVLRLPVPALRGGGLSAAKVAAIRDLAAHVADGRLDPRGLASVGDDEVVERLTRVRGIGPWSAHMHLMFALRRPDVWPTGDLGVRLGMARILGLAEPPAPKALEALGEPFRPYRSTLAWYAWRALEVDFR